jgi:hypothetical protein
MKSINPKLPTIPHATHSSVAVFRLVSLLVCTIGAVFFAPTLGAADTPVPKAQDVSVPGWKMSWVEPGPAIVLVTQEGRKPLEIAVGLARAQKAGENDFFAVVGGAIIDGRIPSASEAAADTSLTGLVKITDSAGYAEWKAKH